MKTCRRTGSASMTRRASGDALDTYFLHDDRLARAVARIARKRGDFVGDVLALDHFSKNRVAVIQPPKWRNRGAELAALASPPRGGHRKPAGPRLAHRPSILRP